MDVTGHRAIRHAGALITARLHGGSLMRPTFRAALGAAMLAAALAAPSLAQSPAPSMTAASSAAPSSPASTTGSFLTWTRTDGLPGKPGGFVTSGAFGADGTLVLVGGMDPVEGPTVAWSSADGVTWNAGKANGPKSDRPQRVLPITTGGYLAFSPRGQLWTSADGTTWKAAKKPLKGIVPFEGAVASDGTLVLAGVNGAFDAPAIASTMDGTKPIVTELPPVDGASAYLGDIAIHPDGRTLVAAGADGFAGTGFWVSADRQTWTGAVAPDPDPNAFLTGIAATPTGFVAVLSLPAGDATDGVVYASDDGLAWEEVLRVPGVILRSPISLPGGGVAVPQAGALSTSADGRTWVSSPEPAFDGPFSVRGSTTAPDGRVLAWGWTSDPQGSVVWLGTPGS